MIVWRSRNQKWYIRKDVSAAGNPCLVVDDNWRTDHPVKYPDGRVAYETPERIPAYVKAQVARLYKTLGD